MTTGVIGTISTEIEEIETTMTGTNDVREMTGTIEMIEIKTDIEAKSKINTRNEGDPTLVTRVEAIRA